jgi:hypothetical protein
MRAAALHAAAKHADQDGNHTSEDGEMGIVGFRPEHTPEPARHGRRGEVIAEIGQQAEGEQAHRWAAEEGDKPSAGLQTTGTAGALCTAVHRVASPALPRRHSRSLTPSIALRT